ncbi:hypothetical protein UlMin_010890 [Ulmus minor]
MDQTKVYKGRQKVEMVKMKNQSNLQVTFSKRRSGLFKKASELCTLCGAEMALIVFSPGKKVFSFGHPCVDSVIDRYLIKNSIVAPQNCGTMQLIEAHRNASICGLNYQLAQVQNQLEAERKRGDDLNKMNKADKAQCWWEGPIEEMGALQLEQMKVALEDLKIRVAREREEKLRIDITNPTFNSTPPGFPWSFSQSYGMAPSETGVLGSTSTNPVIIPMTPGGYNNLGNGSTEFF